MTTIEIMQRIATNHNRIAQVCVSGDNAILIGDTIRDLRSLVQQLGEQAEKEKCEQDCASSDDNPHKNE